MSKGTQVIEYSKNIYASRDAYSNRRSSTFVVGLVCVLALLLAILMLPKKVYAATFVDVSSESEFKSNVTSGNNVRLKNNITLMNPIVFDKDVTVDLNTYKLTAVKTSEMIGVEGGKYLKFMNGKLQMDSYNEGKGYNGTIVMYKVNVQDTIWLGVHKVIVVDTSVENIDIEKGQFVTATAVIGDPGQTFEQALTDSMSFYTTAQEAITAASNGKAVFVLINTDNISVNKPITLDLGSHTASSITVGTADGLTIRNGMVSGNISSSGSGAMTWKDLTVKGNADNSGHATTIESGYYNNGTFSTASGSSMFIKGGYFVNDPSGIVNNENGYVVIPGTYSYGGVTYKYRVTNGFKIYYDANSGTVSKSMDPYETGGTAVTLPTPTKTGDLFDGWYDNPTGGNLIGRAGAQITTAEDITLYAHWHNHVFVYEASGNTIIAYCTNGYWTNPCEYQGKERAVVLTLTANDIIYGGNINAQVTNNVSPATGVAAGSIYYEGVNSTTYTKSTTAPVNIGTYEASVTITAGGVDYVAKKEFTISPAALTITANAQIIARDESIAEGPAQVTPQGLVLSDKVDSIVLTPSTDAATTSGTITPSDAVIKNGTEDRTGNYTITYRTGSLTINKSTPLVSEAPQITYAEPETALVYGDTLADAIINQGTGVVKSGTRDIPGTFVWDDSTIMPQVSDSNVTEYTLNFIPNDTANYNSTTCVQKVKVIPRPLEITWTNDEFIYDAASHKPTATATNLVGSDECTITVSGEQTDSCDQSGVAKYTAQAASVSNPNYRLPDAPTAAGEENVNFHDFVIKRYPISVTAKAQSIVRDDVIQQGVAYVTYDSLKGSDAFVGVTLTASTDEVTTSGTITPSEVVIKKDSVVKTLNYDITYVDGALTITKATPVITYVATVEYVDAAPALVYGDTLAKALFTDGTGVVQVGSKDIPGRFEWLNPEKMPHVSDSETTEYNVVFTPNDTHNYEVVSATQKVTVVPRELELNWYNDTYTYDFVAHKPSADATNLVGNDTCNVTVNGEQTDSCEKAGVLQYMSMAVSADNPDYILSTDPNVITHPFVIYKRSITDDMVNVTMDASQNITTHIVWESLTNVLYELTLDDDYTMTKESDDHVITLTYEGIGNFKETIVRYLSIPQGEGNITTYVDIDENAKLFIPTLEKVSEEQGKSLLEESLIDAGKTEVAEKVHDDDPTVNYNAEVVLKMKEHTEEYPVPEGDEKLVMDNLRSLTHAGNAEVGAFFDLTLHLKYSVQVSSQPPVSDSVQLHEVDAPKMITIVVPPALRNRNEYKIRTYYVVRVHENVPETLVSSESTTISFPTNKFSTYALLYSDADKPADPEPEKKFYGYWPTPTPPAPVDIMYLKGRSPKTSDTSEIYVFGVIAIAGCVMLMALLVKRAKRK